MRKVHVAWSAGMLAVGLAAGCAAEVGAGDETTTSDAEQLTFTPSATSASYAWSPSVGNTVTMTDEGTTVCFLTEVFGLFRDVNDRIRIQKTPTNWLLNGTVGANEGWPGGRARCLNLGSGMGWSGAYTWSAGQAATDLGSSSNRACYLVEVAGKFDNVADTVRTRISGGHWWLDGGTNSGSAVARCVSGVGIFGSSQTVVGEGEIVELFVNSSANGPRACFLTQVGGLLMGLKVLPWLPPQGAANIATYPYQAGNTAYPYVMQVNSNSAGVNAIGGTRCIQ